MERMTAAKKDQVSRRPHDNLPLRLVMLRHECKVSQRQAAARIGVTPRVWQGMEEGRNTANLLGILNLIAREFGYDLDWLTWGGSIDTNDPRQESPDGVSINREYTSRKPERTPGRKTSSPGMGRRLLATKGPSNRA